MLRQKASLASQDPLPPCTSHDQYCFVLTGTLYFTYGYDRLIAGRDCLLTSYSLSLRQLVILDIFELSTFVILSAAENRILDGQMSYNSTQVGIFVGE